MGSISSCMGKGEEEEQEVEEVVVEQQPLKEDISMSINDFELLKNIEKGEFSKTIEVRMKSTGSIYAMKVMNKREVMEKRRYERILAERRIMEGISHPFLVCLKYAFQSQTKLYIVTDFYNGGELYHYLSQGRFSEKRACFYAAEIALGLAHLHKHNIVYRNLKPENLLLDREGHIRITDFSLSKDGVVNDSVNSICGTPEYLSPEILQKKSYGKSVDWWSLGILIYEMLTSRPPFYDNNTKEMYRKILYAPLEKSQFVSAEAMDLCSRLLERDPVKRLGYGGFEEIQAHPWFKDIDWDALYRKEVEPPYQPNVKSDSSTENIQNSFVNEIPVVTPTPNTLAPLETDVFKSFSYVGNSQR